jgi:hypothetical protein
MAAAAAATSIVDFSEAHAALETFLQAAGEQVCVKEHVSSRAMPED